MKSEFERDSINCGKKVKKYEEEGKRRGERE